MRKTTKSPVRRSSRKVERRNIGFVTENEFDLQFGDIFDQINAFAMGEPIHMVNPEAL